MAARNWYRHSFSGRKFRKSGYKHYSRFAARIHLRAAGSGSLLLSGHSINILDSGPSLRSDQLGSSSHSKRIWFRYFDTGTFDVISIDMSDRGKGTTIGTFTLGSSPSSTGTLSVNNDRSTINGFLVGRQHNCHYECQL